MSPRPGRLGILTVIARKRVASPYRALTFSGRLEPCITAGGHIRFGIIRDLGRPSFTVQCFPVLLTEKDSTPQYRLLRCRFRPGLCPLWVICDPRQRRYIPMHVRFASKADK